MKYHPRIKNYPAEPGHCTSHTSEWLKWLEEQPPRHTLHPLQLPEREIINQQVRGVKLDGARKHVFRMRCGNGGNRCNNDVGIIYMAYRLALNITTNSRKPKSKNDQGDPPEGTDYTIQ